MTYEVAEMRSNIKQTMLPVYNDNLKLQTKYLPRRKMAKDLNMRNILTKLATEEIKMVKYLFWLKTTKPDNLVGLFYALNVYSEIYKKNKKLLNKDPEIAFYPREYNVVEERMLRSLLYMAAYPMEKEHENNLGPGSLYKNERYLASPFSDEFKLTLSTQLDFEWPLRLNIKQFFLLMWHVGEFGSRAMFQRRKSAQFQLISFESSPKDQQEINSALTIIIDIVSTEDYKLEDVMQKHAYNLNLELTNWVLQGLSCKIEKPNS